MGMIFEARILDAQDAADAQSSAERLEQLLYDDPEDPSRVVDIDKAWHGIHFLLTGSADEPGMDRPARRRGLFGRRSAPAAAAPAPEATAIFGGEPIGTDEGHGPARLIGAEQVAAIATALGAIDPQSLGARLDLPAMEEAAIYPGIWDEPDVYDTYLGPHYEALRDFYLRAAAENAAVLVSIR